MKVPNLVLFVIVEFFAFFLFKVEVGSKNHLIRQTFDIYLVCLRCENSYPNGVAVLSNNFNNISYFGPI